MREPGYTDLTLKQNAPMLLTALGCAHIVACGLALMMSGRLPLVNKRETPDWRADGVGCAIIIILTPAVFIAPGWVIDQWRYPRTIPLFHVSGNRGDMAAVGVLVLLVAALFALDIWLIRFGFAAAKAGRIPVTKTKAITGDTVGLLGCLVAALGAFLLVGGFCFSVLISIQPH